MITRSQFMAALTGIGVGLLILGIGHGIGWMTDTHTAPPTHIEADNLRYLGPHITGLAAPVADGDSKTNMQCEVNAPAAQPSDDVVPGDVLVDGGAYVYDGKKWRKVPVVQGDCTLLKSGAMECCGGPGRPPCDNGPGPMQGQWMADAAIHYMNCAEGNSEPSDLCCLNEVDEPSPCDIAHGTFSSAPPAVLKGPPTQVCVYDFVGSPYLRLNKAVSDPSCADFDSAPPAVLKGPPAPKTGDCFVYGGEDTFEKVDQCPVTDDNSEDLEQDDYNNEINQGRQL